MPQIKVDHVISFSSEDPVHVANNVLSSDPAKKWKCKSPGEKSATIFLQLERASLITGIDIGNENSAYIEVLVSRSGSSDDYKVLLVMSSFMTPLDARQTQNINKVRMFKRQDLVDPERDQKWDRVKIVCTQPFNRHVQYGLSFVTFHSSDEPVKNTTETTIGKFALRPDSPDNISIGGLFARRKELQEEKQDTLRAAAAIREASSASSLAMYGSPKCKPKAIQSTSGTRTPNKKTNSEDDINTPTSRNRNELLYSKDEEERNEKIDKKIEKKAKEKEKECKTPKNDKKKVSLDASTSKTKVESQKRKRSEERNRKNKKERKTRPFAQLLQDVIFVISGIQNPDRANLRTMALAMGAKYKPDWDNSCTHLICAFANTPKFNQVRGKGKIVTKNWIQDCHSQRKRLPWRRYALDKNEQKDESEEEISEEVPRERTPEKEESPEKEETSVRGETPEKDENDDTDGEGRMEGSDTEERIARIQENQKKQKVKDIFEMDTESEGETSKNPENGLEITAKLRSFFQNKTFHIDLNLDRDILSKINQYVTAYKGKITDEPTDPVDIIVTTVEAAADFKEVNQSATCVPPEWIWECHNSQMLVPADDLAF